MTSIDSKEPATRTSRMGEAALTYPDRLGWPVFPCQWITYAGTCSCGRPDCSNPGKHPLTPHGFKDATCNPDQNREWWSRWPQANIGIPTGVASGFDVLDIDPRHRGDDSLAELESQHGRLPDTVEALTGGGGRHILFEHREGIGNKAGIRPGVDVRGEGGYILVAPSNHHSGGKYQWEPSSRPGEVALAEWPPRLLELVQVPDGVPRPLAVAIEGPIPEGQRNTTLASLAGTMRRRGMAQEAIRAALMAENTARCQPPLPAAEVEKIAASVARYTPERESSTQAAGSFGSDGPIDTPERRNEGATLVPRSLTEFLQETQEVRWQVQDLLPEGAAMIVVADSGTGKTWFTLTLALAVDQGTKFLGRFATVRGKVLIIDEENADPLLKYRLKRLLRGLGLPEDGSTLGIEILTAQGVNLSDRAWVEALGHLLDEKRPDMVIIDALVRVHRGNENDAGEMAQVFAHIKRWMGKYGCSFVFCHHRRKPVMGMNDPSHLFRGSSEIRAFMDSQIDLRPVQGERGLVTVDHAKSRFIEAVAPFNIEIMDPAEDETVVRYAGEPQDQVQEKLSQAQEFIRTLAGDGEWHSRQEILDAGINAGIKRDALDQARKLLVGAGEVIEEKRGKATGIKRRFASDAPDLYRPSEATDDKEAHFDLEEVRF